MSATTPQISSAHFVQALVVFSSLNAMWLWLQWWSYTNSRDADAVCYWARRRCWAGCALALGVQLFLTAPLWLTLVGRPAACIATLCLMLMGGGVIGWLGAQWRVTLLVTR